MITDFERDDGLPAGPDAGIAVEAVGPAPATPDEGAARILDANRDLADALVKTCAALDEAEAERDAYAELVPLLYRQVQRGGPSNLLEVAERFMSESQAALLRRALSVEAAGTEGGGGHE